jgi:CRISPR system Cascade subunit CasC
MLEDNEHLAHLNESERGSVLATFVRSVLLAVPGARKNSMFGFNPPAFVLGLRRRGHPLSLVNAFEKPIRPRGDGYIEPSKEALLEHLSQLRAVYGLKADVEEKMPPQNLDGLTKALVEARPQGEA